MSRSINGKYRHKRGTERFKSGPGGMNCICCFPPPGSRLRHILVKAERRKQKREAFKCEYVALLSENSA